MGHPLLDEFCRAKSLLRPEFFRRCQRVFNAEVTPQLDEIETLRTKYAELEAKLEALQAKAERKRKDAEAVTA